MSRNLLSCGLGLACSQNRQLTKGNTMKRVNYYYTDGTLYLGNKTQEGDNVVTESGVTLLTFQDLDRHPKIFARHYWPHSVTPHPASSFPIKALKPWDYTPFTWHLAKGQING